MAATLVECVQHCLVQLAQSPELATCLNDCQHINTTSAAVPNVAANHHGGLSLPVSVILSCLLVPFTGLFAGLTLGLLSLDLTGLRILAHAGEPEERKYAQKIIPVRESGNLLLCTLLLGNTVINSAISILLADITTGFVGLLVSTFVILVFGEIIPQSICTRHGLKIGAQSIWIVKIFIVLLSPIVWPISLVLDCWLGRDIGNVYSQEELKRLIEIHVTDPDAQAESGLTSADQSLIIGAMEYKEKRVKDVMTSLEQCFMLDKSMRLNFQAMLAVYKSGFTRIPVYSGDKQNIEGILYAKDLILIDPDDEVEIGAVLSFRGRNVFHISEDVTLDKVFKVFMTSANHLLIAHRGSFDENASQSEIAAGEVTGLITLEDVIEQLIQAEIVDETDIFEDVDKQVPRRGGTRVDIARYLCLFDHKLKQAHALAQGEMQAIAAFLSHNVDEFAQLAGLEPALKGLISHGEVLEQELGGAEDGSLGKSADASPHRKHDWGGRAFWDLATEGSHPVLYQRNQPTDTFTLILQGRVLIHTGAEGFELELGPWSVLGNKALSQEHYVPDFDAIAIAPFRLLRIRRPAYRAALEATNLHPVIGYQAANRLRSAVDGNGQLRASAAGSDASFPGFDGVSLPSPIKGVSPTRPMAIPPAAGNLPSPTLKRGAARMPISRSSGTLEGYQIPAGSPTRPARHPLEPSPNQQNILAGQAEGAASPGHVALDICQDPWFERPRPAEAGPEGGENADAWESLVSRGVKDNDDQSVFGRL
ncbi:hypothetical protein WJX72_006765 [[Myrmecia] bisecta]|uniref:CNNM transmembrane domain-containing protein n=1 Tax=[Myrmecia] bisecta TaxID=41462 RepID=A0AAW1PY54_9CHLO